ncbi:MAG TPA: HEPN domain-containing protein [Patescibacteria group bacterium]|nr:HEPN domain-containing protein [Patescibacteria group bacterium]
MKRAPDGCNRLSRICGGPRIWQSAVGHIACFLAQQIGEKALKGFLYAHGEEIVTGHSVERLCRAATHYDPAFDQLVAQWSILDGYYIPTRYPNSVPDSIPAYIFTRNAAGEAVRLAREIVTYVTDRLGRMEG